MPGANVAHGLAEAADQVTREAIDGALTRLGPPPAAFAWVALGSQARGELHLAADQDSALVWADDAAAGSAYAADLAESVVGRLADWGLARCSGQFTADHWSRGVDTWHGLLREWVMSPDPTAVLDTEVFLDFRPVAGDLDVQELADVIRAGAESPWLLRGFAVAAVAYRPHFTLLGHVHGHTIDLKREALAPLVLLARLYGLRAGSAAVSTVDRLHAAESAGLLSGALIERLIALHEVATRLRIAAQVRDVNAGRAPSSVVGIDDMEHSMRMALEDGLHALRSAQSATELVFRTEL